MYYTFMYTPDYKKKPSYDFSCHTTSKLAMVSTIVTIAFSKTIGLFFDLWHLLHLLIYVFLSVNLQLGLKIYS